MMSVNISSRLEKQFGEVVEDDYNGDLQAAIQSFLKLHAKYRWKEQFLEDVESVRSEVRRSGGIKAETIDHAVKQYRKK